MAKKVGSGIQKVFVILSEAKNLGLTLPTLDGFYWSNEFLIVPVRSFTAFRMTNKAFRMTNKAF